MGQEQAITFVQQSLLMAVQLAAPALAAALAVGTLVSLFQAVTQIQEQSLVFVPKVVALLVVLTVAGGWMANTLVGFGRAMLNSLPDVAH